MIIKANFVNCKTFTAQGKELNLNTCISPELGTFNFFSQQALKFDYLKPVQIEFELTVYNSKLGLKLVGVK